MFCVLIFLLPACAHAVVQNILCPNVPNQKVDVNGLEGLWFVNGAVTDIPIEGNCTKIIFNHKDDKIDMSIQWVKNKTSVHYNGTIQIVTVGEGDILNASFSDQVSKNYTLVAASYEHYAVLYSCVNNLDGISSTYELWKLTRTSKLKEKHMTDINNALTSSNITVGETNFYINSEQACLTNKAWVSYKYSVPLTMLGSTILTVMSRMLT